MSLFDGLLLDCETIPAPKRAAARPVSTDVPYVVTIKRASNGDEIMLCNITPPPAGAIAAARSRKLPLFTFDEILAMRQAGSVDPLYIDNIISARRTFGWGGVLSFQELAE